MTRPTAAMIVIGDEILSGRTRDANMHHLAGALTEAGIDLREVRVVADEEAEIVAAVNALRGAYNHVFTSGGIGPTHDDITADSVGVAFDLPVDVRDDAVEALLTNYPNGRDDLNAARLRMARVPKGARLIDNPVSGAPGFSVEKRACDGRCAADFQRHAGGAVANLARRCAGPVCQRACGPA